jgi:hypothetical protein
MFSHSSLLWSHKYSAVLSNSNIALRLEGSMLNHLQDMNSVSADQRPFPIALLFFNVILATTRFHMQRS